ncbi:MAG: penicillin acylase family protein [Steroidobacteraceae bacterium]
MAAGPTGDSRYQADITWTTHGVAHITAEDHGSLGFGQGWACARDQFAAIVDHVVKVRSERARHLGRGPLDVHLHTDLAYLALGTTRGPRPCRPCSPSPSATSSPGTRPASTPGSPSTATDALPAWCRDASWIGPIEPLDLWRVYVDLSIMASGRNLVEYIGSAVPPGGDVTEPVPPLPPEPFTADPGLASNAWAFGRAASATGRGMVMANPHFPWWGEGRFWECHLRIPGQLDIYGASLVGTPLRADGLQPTTSAGRTRSRSATASPSTKLDLVDGPPDRVPLRRRACGRWTPHRVAVDVLGDDGTVDRRSSARCGPRTTARCSTCRCWAGPRRSASPTATPTSTTTASSPRSLAMDTGRRHRTAFQRAVADHQGLPWVNTLAADREGRAWYVDASTTPKLSDEANARLPREPEDRPHHPARLQPAAWRCSTGPIPRFEWQTDPAAPEPGILAFADLPQIERDDHLFNSNDPYWLPHLEARIAEHPALCGLFHEKLSARTRMNALLASGRGPITPSGPGGTLTRGRRGGVGAGQPLPARRAPARRRVRRAVPAAWASSRSTAGPPTSGPRPRSSRRGTVGSTSTPWAPSCGAELLRVVQRRTTGPPPARCSPRRYDPADPVHTPRGLAAAPESGPDPLVVALGRGLHALDAAGIAPDTPLGEVQYVERFGARQPIHGGYEIEGIANVIASVGTLAHAPTCSPAPRCRRRCRGVPSSPACGSGATRPCTG